LLGENDAQEIAPSFQVSDQFKSLENIPLKNRALTQKFSDLAPYFEAGALLVQARGATGVTTKLSGLFLEGRTFINEKETPEIELSLARLQPGSIVKGRTASVLRALGLQNAKHLREADVFAFSPRKGAVIVLICNRPALWRNDALEAAFTHAGGNT
jgi:hypothetical protein